MLILVRGGPQRLAVLLEVALAQRDIFPQLTRAPLQSLRTAAFQCVIDATQFVAQRRDLLPE